jgi:hypothetical protein
MEKTGMDGGGSERVRKLREKNAHYTSSMR